MPTVIDSDRQYLEAATEVVRAGRCLFGYEVPRCGGKVQRHVECAAAALVAAGWRPDAAHTVEVVHSVEVTPVLATRMDAFASTLRVRAKGARPSEQAALEELVDEFTRIRRDLTQLPPPPTLPPPRPTPPLSTAPPVPVVPVPPTAPQPRVSTAQPRRQVGMCDCGEPIVRESGSRGPDPKRCARCRASRGKRPSQQSNQARKDATHPTADTRTCARCRQVKPLDAYNVRNPNTGNVDTYCRSCRHAYAADRYARVGTKVVTVELVPTDQAIGVLCPQCGLPFAAGDHVQAEHLRHETCPTGDM